LTGLGIRFIFSFCSKVAGLSSWVMLELSGTSSARPLFFFEWERFFSSCRFAVVAVAILRKVDSTSFFSPFLGRRVNFRGFPLDNQCRSPVEFPFFPDKVFQPLIDGNNGFLVCCDVRVFSTNSVPPLLGHIFFWGRGVSSC